MKFGSHGAKYGKMKTRLWCKFEPEIQIWGYKFIYPALESKCLNLSGEYFVQNLEMTS